MNRTNTPDKVLQPTLNTVRLRFNVRALTNMANTQRIDELILTYTINRWRKVAFVVVSVLIEGGDELADVNDSEVAERVRFLVKDGRIESRGDLNEIGFSEIRLIQG